MIIDQHRAHVRILYEDYLRQMEQRGGRSQKLLFPEVVQLSLSESVLLDEIMPELEHMGFDVSDLGGGSIAVNGIPADLEGANMAAVFHDIVSAATEKKSSVSGDVYGPLALCLARNAAIPYGQVLTNEAMENLVNTLFTCSNVNYTPDGKIVICILKQQEIDALMG
jgi:DNA mismatch repair protein MutL